MLFIEIARKICELGTKAGHGQAGFGKRELTKRIATSTLDICHFEDADSEGHSLMLLERIADALDRRVEICFSPVKRLRKA